MARDIFRHSAIEKLSSVSQLSKLLVVVRIRGWIVLLSLMAILVAIVVWSVVGQIPIITTGKGILLAPSAQFPIKSPHEGVVKEIFVRSQQKVTEGTPIMELTSGTVIVAPHKGKIFQIDVGEGEPVKTGDLLLWFQTKVFPSDFEVYSFIPAEVGERIRKGMHVTIDLNAIDSQKYGQIIGKVKRVAPYSVSATSVELRVIPSERTREDLTKGATMELIIIQPILDPNNKSGLKWSFGNGPDKRLDPGSTGTVRITIENKKPISYLIPIVS